MAYRTLIISIKSLINMGLSFGLYIVDFDFVSYLSNAFLTRRAE